MVFKRKTKFKIFFKQLLCSHIFEITDKKNLNRKKWYGDYLCIDEYAVYAITSKCVKCNKIQIKEDYYKI